MSELEHIPFVATSLGETAGACSCGWDTQHAYSGDSAWTRAQAMRDAEKHAEEESAK